jgi:hypothetical protein
LYADASAAELSARGSAEHGGTHFYLGGYMKKMFVWMTLGLGCVVAIGSAHAATDQQSKMGTCNADAKTKELKGEERKKFMSECLSAKPAAAASAPETGTAQQNKMKTCNADAKTKDLKGDERKKFMSECLKAK